MKRIFALVLFSSLWIPHLQAQTEDVEMSFGERVGLILNAEGGVMWSRGSGEGAANKLGFDLGLNATYYLLPFIGAGTGVEYLLRGTEYEGGTYSGSVGYIDIPVYLALSLAFGQFRVYTEPGVFFAIATKDDFAREGASSMAAKNFLGFQNELGFLYELNRDMGIGLSVFAKIPFQRSAAREVGNLTDDKRIYDWGLNLEFASFVF